jgi:hypothetical protein
VLDNLSAHKAVQEFLEQNPKVRFHLQPDLLFPAEAGLVVVRQDPRDVIGRGIFISLADLACKLRQYIRAYTKSAKPFRWNYTDPNRRIRTYEIDGTAH